MPLGFVPGQADAWEIRGIKYMLNARPFLGPKKRQCTVQPAIRPGGNTMKSSFISRDTGTRIAALEAAAYDSHAVVHAPSWAHAWSCVSDKSIISFLHP